MLFRSLPGTGMSWTVESTPAGGAAFPAGAASGLPNSRRLRSSQLESLRQTLLGMLQQQLFANGGLGAPLWEANLVSRLLADGSLPARIAGQLATIETPEALEAYLQRAQSQADARRRAQRCIEAVQRARELAAARGWLP